MKSLFLLLLAGFVVSQPTKFPTVPTKLPTKSPSNHPTNNPTNNPTYAPTVKIYLYSSNAWIKDGILGTRSESNWYCQNAATDLDLFCQTHTAFVSYSETDNLTVLASTQLGASQLLVPVHGPGGVLIANNWNDMFSGTLLSTLTEAGVLSNTLELQNAFYTGSDSMGGFGGAEGSCSSWTDNLSATGAYTGSGETTESSYLNMGAGACDASPLSAAFAPTQIVCACFYDGS